MVTIRLPDELRDRIDAVKGDVPRERWVRRALEQALEGAPFPVLTENLAVDAGGTIVKADRSRPARYEEQRPRTASSHLPTCRCGVCRP